MNSVDMMQARRPEIRTPVRSAPVSSTTAGAISSTSRVRFWRRMRYVGEILLAAADLGHVGKLRWHGARHFAALALYRRAAVGQASPGRASCRLH